MIHQRICFLSEEIFGSHLDVLCKRENVTVPHFVIKCIEAVEKRGKFDFYQPNVISSNLFTADEVLKRPSFFSSHCMK